jgi:gas vesicle protein
MSEENKNPNDNDHKVDFDDEKDPIDSIEKTVEDLKRKIQELSDEDEKTEEQQKFDAGKEKITETVDTASKTIADGFHDLKDKVVDYTKSDEMQKSLAYVKEHAVKAMDMAKDTYNKLKNDPNLQAAGNKAVDSIGKFADAAKNKGQEFYNGLDADTKNKIEDTCVKVSDGVKEGIKAVDEYVSRPEVQEKITEVKTTAVDLAQKGTEKVKELIDNTKK